MKNEKTHNYDMDERPKQDLKYSFKLLFKNYKPFLKIQIFSIILTLVMVLVVFGIGFIYQAIFGKEIDEPVRYIVRGFIIIFGGVITIFLSTSSGLAVDILNSGDEFTEFRNAFKYFSKFWWKYLFISILVFGIPSAIQGLITRTDIIFPESIQPPINDISWQRYMIFEAISLIISYTWYSLFMCMYPSLTVQGGIPNAFRENFRIIKKDWKRVFGTWALFFLVFQVPVYIFASLTLLLHVPPFGILWIVFMLINIFIGNPLQYLLSAGIYFNTEFERYQPLD